MLLFALIAVVVVGYLAFTTVAPTATAPLAVASGKTYSATVYVAGMGGHFAKADVTIDPSNEGAPIKVNNLDRVVIGDGLTVLSEQNSSTIASQRAAARRESSSEYMK